MKRFVYLLAGIGLFAFGVHVYNDAGTIPLPPTEAVAQYKIAVTPQGWAARPVGLQSESQSPMTESSISASTVQGNRLVAGAEVNSIDGGKSDTTTAPMEVPRSVETAWARPAQVQVNVRDSRIDTALSFAGLILLVGTLAILATVIRSARRGRATTPSDDSLLVHELARRAQEMSQRMEALETILLDRTRAAR